MLQTIRDSLFGYDFFISYGHIDGRSYAESLVEKLEAEGFRCFLDREDLPAGEGLSKATRRGARRSRVLLLVGTARALKSDSIYAELSLFHGADRTIIPIDLGNTLSRAPVDNRVVQLLGDTIRVVDTADGSPSAPSVEVLRRIAGSFRYTRQDRRRQRWLAGAAVLFAGLALGASIAAYLAMHERRIEVARALSVRANLMQTRQFGLLPQSLLIALESRHIEPALETDEVISQAVQTLAEPETQLPHPNESSSLVTNADGTLAVTSCDDGRVRVWNTATGQVLRIIDEGTPVDYAEFSPNEKSLLTITRDSLVHIRSIATGEELVPPLKHTDLVTIAHFSPSGSWVATGGVDRHLRVWRSQDGSRVLDVPFSFTISGIAFTPDSRVVVAADRLGHVEIRSLLPSKRLASFAAGDAVVELALSPDGKQLATASSGRGAALWTVPDGKLIVSMTENKDANSVSFSPDGKLAGIAVNDNSIRIWNLDEHREIERIIFPSDAFGLQFSPDNAYLLGSLGGATTIIDVAHGVEVRRLTNDSGVQSQAFLRDSARVATISTDGTARVWRFRGAGRLMEMLHNAPIQTVIVNQPSGVIVTGDFTGTFKVWSAQSGELTWMLQPSNGGPANGSVSSDGKFLAIGNGFRSVSLWSIAEKRELRHFDQGRMIDAIQFSPDAKTLAVSAWDDIVRFWDLSSGKLRAQLPVHPSRIRAIAFSPDGQFVATACIDGVVRVWNSNGSKEITEFHHGGQLWDVAFDKTGQRIVSASSDHTAKIWDLSSRSQTPLHVLEHDNGVSAIALSPYGQQVATASWDGAVRVWDLKTGAELARLARHDGLLAVAFSPDGHAVVTAGYGQRAEVLLWDPGSVETEACHSLTRNLSQQEWNQYIPELRYNRTCSFQP